MCISSVLYMKPKQKNSRLCLVWIINWRFVFCGDASTSSSSNFSDVDAWQTNFLWQMMEMLISLVAKMLDQFAVGQKDFSHEILKLFFVCAVLLNFASENNEFLFQTTPNSIRHFRSFLNRYEFRFSESRSLLWYFINEYWVLRMHEITSNV